MKLHHRTSSFRSLLFAVALAVTGCATPFTGSDSATSVVLTEEQVQALTGRSSLDECGDAEPRRRSKRVHLRLPPLPGSLASPLTDQATTVLPEPVWDVEEVSTDCCSA